MWDHVTGECPDGTYEIEIYKANTGAAVDGAGFPIMVT